MSKQEKTYFQDNWSEIDESKDWIARSSVNTQARCKRCHKTFALSNMGVQALRSHASGKKHKEITQKVSSFFKTKPVKESSHEQKSKEDNERTKKAQTSIELTLTSADVTKAEIRWALDGILKGNSNNQNANIGPLLNACFPGHETIKLFSLGADKLRYSCNYGLAPYFRSILQDEVKRSEIYVMSFDESLNDANQKCQMDLIVRYWDEKTQQVKVRYWDCSYLGHSTHADLLEHFSKTTESLDPSKMVQVSMDGPNVNLKFLKTLISSREEIKLPSLVDIGTCPLHTVNNSFQVGAKNAEWDLKKTLKGIWQIFHDSPARREDYEKETGSTVYPKAFCSTRWTENKPTAERAISIWPYIEQIVTYWEKKPPNKRPKSKSYANVKTAVNDPLTVVKLKFFAYVAGILEPFLKMYQTDKPMIPFLYFDLKSIVLTLMKLFIKPNCVSGAKTGMQLCGIDLENESNQINLKDIGLGFAAEEELEKLKTADLVTATKESSFFKEVRTFLISLIKKLLTKTPLTSVVVRFASIFDPSIIISTPTDKIEKNLKKLLHHLLSLKIVTAKNSDKIHQEFHPFHKDVKAQRDKFEAFSKSKDSLDTFYFGLFPKLNDNFPNLAFLLKLIFVLSHGQASVERGFSLRNASLKDNISELSIDSKHVIVDHMLSNDLKPETMDINTPLMVAFKSGRAKYEESKKQAKKEKIFTEQEIEENSYASRLMK
ncbi:uncharacterized protein [Clytia hemisphaerica]|uniref:uncharacterized protein n=1 Tax=Clytia hemisphaerica TaxID=252671 RepID=UPI0034D3CC3F